MLVLESLKESHSCVGASDKDTQLISPCVATLPLHCLINLANLLSL